MSMSRGQLKRIFRLFLFDRPRGEYRCHIFNAYGYQPGSTMALGQMLDDGEVKLVNSGRGYDILQVYQLTVKGWLMVTQEEPTWQSRELKKLRGLSTG